MNKISIHTFKTSILTIFEKRGDCEQSVLQKQERMSSLSTQIYQQMIIYLNWLTHWVPTNSFPNTAKKVISVLWGV